MTNKKKTIFPPQHQVEKPGLESLMRRSPESIRKNYKPTNALEGAKVVIIYLNEHHDTDKTQKLIITLKVIAFSGDVGECDGCY